MIGLSFRSPLALIVAALMVCPLLSCMEAESVVCPSGRVCGPRLRCAAFQDICINTPCGDGIVQADELCDDGNVKDGDGCSRDCRSKESCGDGIVDTEAGEVCDDGNTQSGDRCSADCKSTELCGNGVVDTAVGEVCDDKNTRSGDGCSGDCQSNEQCGNGVVDTAAGEVCDDGDTANGDGCSSDCRSGEGCGNGIRDPEEECDDGNKSNEDNCLTTCLKPRCGDGYQDKVAPGQEECDTGGESDSCNNNCTVRRCGDGMVNHTAGEECDPGGAVDTLECDADCTFAGCGDGFTNAVAGEECDDHNTSNQDDCLNSCHLNTCGDGAVDLEGPSIEICDDGNIVEEEGCPYGTPTCTACGASCTAILQLTGPVCGDGIQNGNEACDDGNTLACGTCSALCTQIQQSKASGSITVVDPGSIRDNPSGVDTFSLGDGINIPTVFEFNKGQIVTPGRVEIRLTELTSSEEVANAVALAINSQQEPLAITAEASGDVVNLVHDNVGAFGNQSIVENVHDNNFKVTGMSGGKGRDCPNGTACGFNDDCASGVCSSSVCVEPETP